MILAGFDLETTGFDPAEHRIVEAYVSLWDSETRKLLFEFDRRVNPQRSIPIEAQRVHGITPADVASAPVWDDVAPKIHAVLSKATVFVAHNGKSFDGPFLTSEFKRVGLKPIERPMLDTMVDARWATVDGKLPTLGDLCFACGVHYDPALAHSASYDVEVMMKCAFFGLDCDRFDIKET